MLRAVVVLALLLVATPAVSALSVPGTIQGAGNVSTYYIVTGGPTVQGGAFQREMACYGCYVRLTIVSGTFEVAQDGAVTTLAPGVWEIRGFAGVIGIDQNGLGDFFVELHGTGRIAAYA